MQIVSYPYIYWVCGRLEYLTKLWGFVGLSGSAVNRIKTIFTPTLHTRPSRAHRLTALTAPQSLEIVTYLALPPQLNPARLLGASNDL